MLAVTTLPVPLMPSRKAEQQVPSGRLAYSSQALVKKRSREAFTGPVGQPVGRPMSALVLTNDGVIVGFLDEADVSAVYLQATSATA